LGAGAHGVDDHGVVSVDAEHANLEQFAIVGRTDAHREVVIESPLGDGVTRGVEHVLVSDVVLPSCLPDTHDDKISCQTVFVKEPCQAVWIKMVVALSAGKRVNPPMSFRCPASLSV
jgi:hypothetical protein